MSESRPGLSLIVIASNEERDLPACLASARGLADELIVVVDAATSDRTAEVAAAAGAKVLTRAFTSFAEQKQFAVDAASREWVLNLDADERLSPEISEAIARALKAPESDGYRVEFSIQFLGRAMRHGGLGGERKLRFFRRAAGRFSGGLVHEGVELSGRAGDLPGVIWHRPYADLSEAIEKLDRYTTLAARKAWAEGRTFRFHHHLVPAAVFLKRYLLQLGVLDGSEGLAWAALSAFNSWAKYAKLRELERA